MQQRNAHMRSLCRRYTGVGTLPRTQARYYPRTRIHTAHLEGADVVCAIAAHEGDPPRSTQGAKDELLLLGADPRKHLVTGGTHQAVNMVNGTCVNGTK